MKMSQYNYLTNYKNGIVVLNTLNSKYVKITKKEDIDHFYKLYNNESPIILDDDMVKALYNNGYVVDSNINEYNFAKLQVDNFIADMAKKLQVVIYVTEQCNFRCVYCPEKHTNNKFSDTNWEAMYKFIEKSVNTGKYEVISICFFGGEPLLEKEKIIYFLEKLKNLSNIHKTVSFNHQITSNGYLLTPEIYDRLASLNVLQYQITVDGFAETHNNMRPLVNGKETWDKIIENLKYINSQDDNAHINLRTNYNSANFASLEKYNIWQKQTFNNPKFEFDYHPVVAFSDMVPEGQLADSNLRTSSNLPDNYKFNMFKKFQCACKASFPSNYTVSVKGEITKCENLTDDNYDFLIIGNLTKEGEIVFNDGADAWFNDFETEKCKECFLYPICCARACPAKKVMYPDSRPDCDIIIESFSNHLKNIFENDQLN